MKHLKKFENFEPVNESISDILYVAAIIFGSLFGLSLTATAIVLVKSKRMRTMLKELKDLVKDFNENPTDAKKNKIFDNMKDILDGDEFKEIQSLISKSNSEVMKSLK